LKFKVDENLPSEVTAALRSALHDAGIIVLRLRNQETRHIEQVVSRLLAVLAAEPVAGAIWIVEETRIRVRG
jgi:predicted nuclease of predicted toxin-antitoxin system